MIQNIELSAVEALLETSMKLFFLFKTTLMQIWQFFYVFVFPWKCPILNPLKPLSQLTLSWRRFLSSRNQSIDLLCESFDWFLYGRDLRHERVNVFFKKGDYILMQFLCLICACLKIGNMNYNDYKPHLKIQLLLWKYFRIGHTNANYAPTRLILWKY